jgi:SET domain-containing protein
VAQRGCAFHLELVRTLNKGWAVRTLETIPRGSFVVEYAAEVIHERTAQRRSAVNDSEGDNYMFSFEDTDLSLDAQFFGSAARFVNHSCDPNLVKAVFFHEHDDRAFPRLAFIAARRIEAGEELTVDYSYEKQDCPRGVLACRCGSHNCRLTLL